VICCWVVCGWGGGEGDVEIFKYENKKKKDVLFLVHII